MHPQQALTYADLWRPLSKNAAIAYDTALILGGSWLIALSAHLYIPLPHTPVPITAQSMIVLMLGVWLGSRKGAASAMLYLAQGVCGLPFFAGGKSGMGILSGVTGGYLFGFVLAAFVAGWFAERKMDREIFPAIWSMLVGTAVIFACGLFWMKVVTFGLLPTTSGLSVLNLGLYPFIPGAVVKLLVASLILPIGWALLGENSASSK